ncbi:hypothetical protein G6F57_010920 [Rhizopus arrhizus]|nr:hypothetical protein G6F30_011099 [Rhizopus arrhizus]KAG1407146.1 hypothetical protein G6F58_009712 [Rhizopus delemar]KAG0975793.1 hypothetical protein G6F29_011277 [Rhizopus arrhizus]KAG0983127.1 hypothetical protein G6F28_011025 [Rhizopus arrhizus]KAG1003191.1 hypothetical protein G6F27_011274 [Rhizopus arrhizus]
MIKNINRTDKTSKLYGGPYTIHASNKNSSYILKDKAGALLPRIPTSYIILISSNNAEPDLNDKRWELQEIVNHIHAKHGYEYRVRWKSHHPGEDIC